MKCDPYMSTFTVHTAMNEAFIGQITSVFFSMVSYTRCHTILTHTAFQPPLEEVNIPSESYYYGSDTCGDICTCTCTRLSGCNLHVTLHCPLVLTCRCIIITEGIPDKVWLSCCMYLLFTLGKKSSLILGSRLTVNCRSQGGLQ